MKKMLTLTVCAWLLSLTAGCALAQELAMPAVPITVEAHIRDADGKPVEGATIHLVFPRYRLGDKNQLTEGITDGDGITTVSGIAQQDYKIGVDKAGYYHTTGPWRGINDEKGFQQYAVGVQKIDLELRPIRNPIRCIVKFMDRARIPASDAPVGFDLEAGDWVAPYGQGRNSDLHFKLGGYIHSNRDYDLNLTLTFSCEGDGLVQTELPEREGSAFKFPYEAPLTGYEPQRTWFSSYDGKTTKNNFGSNAKTAYIFRVRTELDEKKNIRRALCGTINSEILLGGSSEGGQTVSFIYRLNPDWTRNLEFDSKKMFEAGTGKLLVEPPPEQ